MVSVLRRNLSSCLALANPNQHVLENCRRGPLRPLEGKIGLRQNHEPPLHFFAWDRSCLRRKLACTKRRYTRSLGRFVRTRPGSDGGLKTRELPDGPGHRPEKG